MHPITKLIAEIDGKKLATICFIEGGIIRGSAMLDMSNEVAYLYGFYVSPKYRRQGIATEIFSNAVKIAKQNSKKGIYLTVKKANKSALKLYHKLGFAYGSDDKESYWMNYQLAK